MQFCSIVFFTDEVLKSFLQRFHLAYSLKNLRHFNFVDVRSQLQNREIFIQKKFLALK